MLLNYTNTIIAQIESKSQTISYHGIRADDPGGRCGLLNPERGFRLTSMVGQPPGAKLRFIFSLNQDRLPNGFTDDWLLTTLNQFKSEGITLTSAYCYLNDFSNKPLSDERIALIQQSLDRYRQAGIKIMLRFAYEENSLRKKGPTFEMILTHLEQLAPLIKRNKDIIYTMQATFIGAFGEWHNSTHYIEEDHSNLEKLVKRELEILPKDRMLQLRVLAKSKRWIFGDSLMLIDESNAFSGKPEARIGFGDMGFLSEDDDGGTWTEPPFYANAGNPEFDYVTKISPYIVVTGEPYWKDVGGQIGGKSAIRRLRLHHWSSLSITQTYSGFYDEKRYSIDHWMETLISEEDIKGERLPLSDGYFKSYEGKPVERTAFEYIRDHLGYRIELQSAKFSKEVTRNKTLSVEIELINRGFATLINPRPVYFALINTSGEIVLTQKSDANPQTWQPYKPGDLDYKPLTHSFEGDISIKQIKNGEYMLGLWLPDADESIQLDSR
ncbi:MAG: DUF4832 domain-containing protein, partial [Melioribacteraceae bacterium]|nr:DUF4832 domain-containing protein [Melioribacteraceae bacterium]